MEKYFPVYKSQRTNIFLFFRLTDSCRVLKHKTEAYFPSSRLAMNL